MMTPIPIDGPAVEPIGMPDMRAYLRLDDGAEDDLIAALVKTARVHVEAAAGRVLVESRWRMGLDAWPEGRVVPLPVSPLIAVERVRVFDRDGGAIDVPRASTRPTPLATRRAWLSIRSRPNRAAGVRAF
jgi:uncharacterized phiE125 gp8 family phage protein